MNISCMLITLMVLGSLSTKAVSTDEGKLCVLYLLGLIKQPRIEIVFRNECVING